MTKPFKKAPIIKNNRGFFDIP